LHDVAALEGLDGVDRLFDLGLLDPHTLDLVAEGFGDLFDLLLLGGHLLEPRLVPAGAHVASTSSRSIWRRFSPCWLPRFA
jgi:hypothetical protein